MGQKSQIYIRYEEDGVKKLIARYYQWNYAERMISRARYLLEWLESNKNFTWEIERKAYRIADTNFDFIDCVISSDIIKEFQDDLSSEKSDFNKYVFDMQDNNDGKLYIDVTEQEIKYCFTDSDNNLLNADEYMIFDTKGCYDEYKWNNPENMKRKEMKKCVRNIKWIEKNFSLMNKDELNEFLTHCYIQPKF